MCDALVRKEVNIELERKKLLSMILLEVTIGVVHSEQLRKKDHNYEHTRGSTPFLFYFDHSSIDFDVTEKKALCHSVEKLFVFCYIALFGLKFTVSSQTYHNSSMA